MPEVIKFPTLNERMWLELDQDLRAGLAKAGLGTPAIETIARAIKQCTTGIEFDISVDCVIPAQCEASVRQIGAQMEPQIKQITWALIVAECWCR
jgi:hypothetical protein